MKSVEATPLSAAELDCIDRFWRAANYLAVGQIYLLDNPLLDEPLADEHVKPRLLGHWGTTPGLAMLYAHLSRTIARRELDMLFVTGPGHGGPALAATTWLEGSWSETYPGVGRDRAGMAQLCRQFSFPGGIPSHVAAEIPGSIHEGGELGYSLSHAFGAAFDNPDLIVACVVGDGEAETGPLATSWHGTKFVDPVGDGAVLPILHLNGYKIANPTVLDRIGDEELDDLLRGNGWEPYLVEGSDPAVVHQRLAATLDVALDEIATIQQRARGDGEQSRPRWPMIVFRTPKGWTGPKEVDGKPVEGTWRAHQVPFGDVRGHPERLRLLEDWLRSYRPDELFDADGRPQPDLLSWLPAGDRRMGSNPHSNGGRLLRPLVLPDLRDFAVGVEHPGTPMSEPTRVLGAWLRDIIRANEASRNFRLMGPDETDSNRLSAVYEATNKVWQGRDPRGRRAPGAAGPGDGDPLRAHLPGLAGGLPAHRPARVVLVLRGVHPHHRLDVQPARQVAQGDSHARVAAQHRLAQLPADVARLASGPQRLQPPGSRLHRPRRQQEGRRHPRLPAAGHQLPAVRRRPLPAQPRLRQRHRVRQAADADVAGHGRRPAALRPRHRHLGVGEQRRRPSRRRARLRRRRADRRGARRHVDPARAPARPARAA